MKLKTYKRAKVASLIFGFLYMGGIIWFWDDYSKSIFTAALTLSTGLALLINPLISDALLKFKPVRLACAILGIGGILNLLRILFDVFINSKYLIDTTALTLQTAFLILFIVIFIRRVVDPHFSKELET